MKTILPFVLILFLASCSSNGTQKTYTLDMFSILSFGLAIASIILSFYMGWLSWVLYKKSSQASDKTQDAVVRIENSVLGIRSDITEIVRKAVGFWTNGNTNSGDNESSTMNFQSKIDELTQRISELAETNDPKNNDLETKLKELMDIQKQEIDRLKTSLLEEKVRSIFPSGTTNSAINLSQEVTTQTTKKNQGVLNITINRPVKIATATGKLIPSLKGNVIIDAKLVSSPYRNPSDVILTSGIGQYSDFHVHLKVHGGILDTGEYVVDYTAESIQK